MKLLKIERSQGFFLAEGKEYLAIDKLTKEHLLKLVDFALTKEEIEFDEYNEEMLQNQAHQIIYLNIYRKLRELIDNREQFIDDTETLYLKEYQKYQNNLETN